MSKPTKLHEVAARHKLGVTAVFIPFSQSRNKDSDMMNLNWKVTLTCNGRSVVTTNYSAGQAHCPAYENPPKLSNGAIDKYLQRKRITDECQNGKVSKLTEHGSRFAIGGAPILPDECDVIYALVSDSDVLNYCSFEQWASDFGYDEDSRKAKSIYDDCMSIALNLRGGLGDSVMSELQLACQEY